MGDPMLLGAAIFGAGALCGRFMPARRKHPKSAKPPKPVCGCGHHHSYHDPKTGKCSGTNRRVKYSDYGSDLGYRDFPCTCQQYSGPVPLPEYMAQEIASEDA